MRLWRKGLAILAAGALALGLTACGGPAEGQSSTAAGSTAGDAIEVTDLAGRSVAIPAGADSFVCIGPGCLRLYCYVAEKSQLAGIEDVEKSWGQAGRPYAMALGDVEDLAAIGPGGPGSARHVPVEHTDKNEIQNDVQQRGYHKEYEGRFGIAERRT